MLPLLAGGRVIRPRRRDLHLPQVVGIHSSSATVTLTVTVRTNDAICGEIMWDAIPLYRCSADRLRVLAVLERWSIIGNLPPCATLPAF
jgi:hypothetical protein